MNTAPPASEIDKLFDQGELIKAGKIREVRKHGDIFLKLDRRKNSSFKKEFNCAIQLKKHGIPVTEPLFHAATPRGNYLATRAFDGIAVDEYLKKNHPDKEFFRQAAKLVVKMLDANFIHMDFHLGNLLYSPASASFVLVDVDSIKKVPAFVKRFIPEHLKYALLFHFRQHLTDKELLELFEFSGVADAEKLYHVFMTRNTRDITHHWPKRREQVLQGYKKFTYCVDGDIFDSDADEAAFAGAESFSSGRSLFLAHFYLSLICIPHRKALRFSPETGEVLLAPENPEPAPESEAAEMVKRLRFYGIETDISDWRKNPRGLPELNAVEKVATQPFIM